MLVGPLGVSHGVTADDEYQGHLIPKGTIIIAVSSFSDEYIILSS